MVSFTETYNRKDLPAPVLSRFADQFGLANPGQKFQVTDFITEPGLPWRRLIFAAVSSDYCIVHFEKGGIAHSFYVVLFRVQNGTASAVWVASLEGKLRIIGELKTEVEGGRLLNGRWAW